MRRTVSVVIRAVAVMAAARTAGAQQADSSPARVAQGAFVGLIKSSVTGRPVQSADIRLFFIDSARMSRDSAGRSSPETFIDTTRSRLGVSDSLGSFAIWRVASGHYLITARRIGYAPTEAFLTIDTS